MKNLPEASKPNPWTESALQCTVGIFTRWDFVADIAPSVLSLVNFASLGHKLTTHKQFTFEEIHL